MVGGVGEGVGAGVGAGVLHSPQVHIKLAQSKSTRHFNPGAQPGQLPPQSRSVSSPSNLPLEQNAGVGAFVGEGVGEVVGAGEGE